MKKLILSILLASLAGSVFATQTIHFATSATYPPFESLDSQNQLVGIDIDLANALCQQMQATCTFTDQAFESLIPGLRFKKFDAVIAGIDMTPARRKQVTFTDSYYATAAMIIAPKGQFDSLAALKGQRIGVENGTTHQRYLHDKHPEIIMVPYDNYQNAFTDLQNGRLTGVLGDKTAINAWLKTHPGLQAVTPGITDPEYYGSGTGIAVRLGNTTLADQFNAALKAIKADGTYQKILEKWSM